MGCFWSNCGEEQDRCIHCGRRPVNNLVVINHVCEICTSRSRSRHTANSSYQRSTRLNRTYNLSPRARHDHPRVCSFSIVISSHCHSTYTLLPSNQLKPLYGEYRCSCGRFWSSRCARAGLYQNCEHCRKTVYPENMREVRRSDYDAKEDKEHKKELCQMCQQLGYHCSLYGKRDRSRSKSRSCQKRY